MKDFEALAIMSLYFGAVSVCCYVGASFLLNDPNGWMLLTGLFCFLSAPMLVIVERIRNGGFD